METDFGPSPVTEPERDEKFWSRNLIETSQRTQADTVALATWSEHCYREIGIEPQIVWKNIERVVDSIQPVLNKNTHNSTPSIFKRAAALTLAFIEVSPLDGSMVGSAIGERLTRLTNHQNSIVVFEFCRQILHGAKLIHSEGEFAGKEFILEKKIAVSQHFYCDLIFALGCEGREGRSFHSFALLYEALAFKGNPTASYKETV